MDDEEQIGAETKNAVDEAMESMEEKTKNEELATGKEEVTLNIDERAT